MFIPRCCSRSFQQEAQEGEMYELQAGIEQTFGVFPQPSGLFKPAKGAFDNSTLRHDHESMQRIAFGHLRLCPQFLLYRIGKGRSTIAAINQHTANTLQVGYAPLHGLQGSASICHIGRR
jgi:hypothetical protein